MEKSFNLMLVNQVYETLILSILREIAVKKRTLEAL